MDSPALSDDSLVSPGPECSATRGKHVEAEKAESKQNVCASQHCESDAAPLSKENVCPENGYGNFQASLHDLAVLEKQLDAALGIKPGPSVFVRDEERDRSRRVSNAEARELKARLRKAENDLRFAVIGIIPVASDVGYCRRAGLPVS